MWYDLYEGFQKFFRSGISTLIDLLPHDPFTIIIDVNLQRLDYGNEYFNYLNWFVDVGFLLEAFSLFIGALVVYNSYYTIQKIFKMIS